MTGGGWASGPHYPPPCSGPSVKAYFLVHVRSLHLSTILLFVSLIFRLCWLWRNRELVWDIVRGKFAKQLLSVFFLPNEVISYVYKGQSICSVLVNMQHHVVVQVGLSLAHFDPFRFWLFWCLISRYFKAVGCFLQSKNTISFIYSIPNNEFVFSWRQWNLSVVSKTHERAE